MPRRGDNIRRTATGGWRARAKTKQVIAGPTGAVTRWKSIERTFKTHEDARAWKREVEVAEKSGAGWTDKRTRAVASMRNLAFDYLQAARDADAPPGTVNYRSSMMGCWLDFLGGREESHPPAAMPVTELSRDLLCNYAISLPSEGRKAMTRYRKVLEVEHMWSWAFENHPDRYPALPPPRKYTCGSNESNGLRRPQQAIASAAPRWADVDKMIRCLTLDWHRKAALVARYTGLRASQVTGLHWRDVDLEQKVLRVRAGVTGAKRSRSRVVPLHADLVRRMRSWPTTDALVFPRRYRSRKTGEAASGPYRGDTLNVPFRRAWEKTDVPRERWDKAKDPLPGDRGTGRPVHAIRGCCRTELIRAGVAEPIALYLIGHSQGITAAAYVPESDPQESPYWPRMVEAVATIPAFED
jgi:integrase